MKILFESNLIFFAHSFKIGRGELKKKSNKNNSKTSLSFGSKFKNEIEMKGGRFKKAQIKNIDQKVNLVLKDEIRVEGNN